MGGGVNRCVSPLLTILQRGFMNLTSSEYQVRRVELLEKLRVVEEQEQKYVEENRIEFFKPIEPYQSRVLGLIHAGKKTVTLQGANQIGKTVLGAVVVGSFCLGIQPWDGGDTIFGRKVVRGRIICSDWEKHASTVIVPELKRWLPVGQYETKKNNQGVEHIFEFRNGSSLELITNKQDTKDHEGWKGDFIWADEPPERAKYVANKRGLIASNGVFLLTMTAVSESWILDEIVLNTDPSFASVTEIPIRANPHLSEEGIHSFEISLREDEKIARIEGGWLNLTGLVLKGFKPDIHLIKPFEVPTDWPVVSLVDFHLKNPIAVSFYAVDPRGITYVVEEIWKNMVAEETSDEIIRRKKTKGWRIEEAYIDPLSKGDTNYVKNMTNDVPADTFKRMEDKLYREGIELKVASKDKDSGVKNLEDMLAGINGMPTLFFFNNLNEKQKKEGHIWEIQRWVYDDNGLPRKENDHFMENLYRMTLTGTKYTSFRKSGYQTVAKTDFDPYTYNTDSKYLNQQEYAESEFNVFER